MGQRRSRALPVGQAAVRRALASGVRRRVGRVGREDARVTNDCLFCKIVAGEVPADVVHQTDATVAFRDINPQAPTHVVVIPRAHHANAAGLAGADPTLAADVLVVAGEVARLEGLTESGYRLVFNTGPGAGQTVFHVHCHVLGGRALTWPPG
jgi:histidine triad (HIT) family protein